MEIAERLRATGRRWTPQRQVILDVLSEKAGHPMHPEEVFRACADRDPSLRLGLTTVYRTLELFCDEGIIQQVHLHGDAQYYELNTGTHHHHIVCVGCGSVDSIEECVIEEMASLIRDQRNFHITSHCLSLFGYCPDCLPEKVN